MRQDDHPTLTSHTLSALIHAVNRTRLRILHLTSTVVTSRFHVQHQGPEVSLQDFYISSRFHEEDVVRGVYWHGYPIYDRLAPIQYKT